MTEPRTYADVLADAIRILTEAARLTRTRGEGELAKIEQIDWAEFVTLATASAAANIGGIEDILAGRPGSWEADRVRQMLESTIGDDTERLLSFRTEPLRFVVNVDNLMVDLDQDSLYDDAEDELQRQEDAVVPTYPADSPEAAAAPPLTDAQEQAVERFAEIRDRLDAQKRREWAAYGDALATAILRVTAELYPALPVPVEIEIHLDWQSQDTDRTEPLVWRIWDRAINETPLPSGLAPRDYPQPANTDDVVHHIAQADRQAGRTPLNRLQARNGQADE